MRFQYFDMLSGVPLELDGVGHLRSPKLKDITLLNDVGYKAYSLYLNVLSWDKESFFKFDKAIGARGVEILQKKLDDLSAFDVATLLPHTRELCRKVLSFFMVEDLTWEDEARKFVATPLGDDAQHIAGEITKDNFEDVREAMLQLNFVGIDKEDNPVSYENERAKQLWEKAQNFLKQQAKQREETDTPEFHLSNIVSKLCTAHPSYNLLNVWDLTIFQVYDAFFQCNYVRSTDLLEAVFTAHGGDNFKFEDWLRPIFRDT